MHSLVMYFQVHQPLRLRPFQFFDIGSGENYFDDALNRKIIQRVSVESYLKTNKLLLNLIRKHPQIKVAFSVSGITIDQLADDAPEVIESFRALAATGSVEFLCETDYHSLSCLLSGDEFESQVLGHAEKLLYHFGVRPSVFRNTELIYNNDIGKRVSMLGFNGIFCDGIERVLGDQSHHKLYHHPEEKNLCLLMRNYRLSDDIAFRFNDGETRLSVERYMSWLHAVPEYEPLVTLAMDYETFGNIKRTIVEFSNSLKPS